MEFVIVSLHPHLKPDGYYKGKATRKGKRLPVFSTDRSCAAIYQSYVKADRIRQMILDGNSEACPCVVPLKMADAWETQKKYAQEAFYREIDDQVGLKRPGASLEQRAAAIEYALQGMDAECGPARVLLDMLLDLREEMENAPAGGNRTGRMENNETS